MRTKTDRPVEYNVIVHDTVRAMVLVSKFGSFPSIWSTCMMGSGTPGDENVTCGRCVLVSLIQLIYVVLI